MKKIKLVVVFLLLLIPSIVLGKELNVYLFYGDGCPHCEEEMKFLDDLMNIKDNITLHKYEVWYNKDNVNKLKEVSKITKVDAGYIPYFIVGDSVLTGYSADTKNKIEEKINYCLENSCSDDVGVYLGITDESGDDLLEKDTTFTIPILGKITAKKVSIPLLAIVMGLVDGFNPCAMWILIFLISMMFSMKDKKKMWILGLTFIITSGVVYFLFMASWLSLASVLNKILLIKILVAIFAMIFGIINIYNYFKSLKKDTGCDVTNKKQRKKIIAFIKKIISEKKFIIAIIGIIILAFSINLIELLCSLGLPMIFTQVLSLNSLSNIEYLIYMFIYIFFFLIDDIIVFLIAMKTLEIKAISNKYSKYSHLIGGIIMFIIGLLLIIKPEWVMFNF